MLNNLLTAFPHLPERWEEGALFSGGDQDIDHQIAFIAALGISPFDLVIHTPSIRYLRIHPPGQVSMAIVTRDVLAGECPEGEVVVTFSAWHTVVGLLPSSGIVSLCDDRYHEARLRCGHWISEDGGHDVLVLSRAGPLFALAYGANSDEAFERSREGLSSLPWQEAEMRLAAARAVPAAMRDDDPLG
jgi:hypothetical protein